jgi:hypothetical protein
MEMDPADPLRPSRLLRRGNSVMVFRHGMSLLPSEAERRVALAGYVTCQLPPGWPSRVFAKVREVEVDSGGIWLTFEAFAFQVPVVVSDDLIWTVRTAIDCLDPASAGSAKHITYLYRARVKDRVGDA